MKTIKVSPRETKLHGLLKKASQENLILKAPDGREFILAELDDFDREIELTRQNKEFMRFLDVRGREKATLSLAEVRRKLGLVPPRNRNRRTA
jgi:hypothetical protein